MTTDSSILMREWLNSMEEPGKEVPVDLATAFRGSLHPLLLGGDAGDRATCLLFKPDRSEPELVLKLARCDAGRRALKNEYEVLRALDTRFPASPDRFFPRAVVFHDWGRFAGLMQEAAAGETWFRRLRKPPGVDAETAAGLARDVLARLSTVAELAIPGSESSPSPGTLHAQWESCIDEMAERLSAVRSVSETERKALTALKRKIRSIDTFLFQHGDLFPKNILLSGTRTGAETDERPTLLDWAEAGPHLPPFFDAVLLLSTLWWEGTGPLTEEERVHHFRRVFWDSTALVQLVEDTFGAGWDRWNLASDWRREDVILLALAVYARRIASLYGSRHGELNILIKNIEYTLSRVVGS